MEENESKGAFQRLVAAETTNLLLPGEPLTDEQWLAELRRAEASDEIVLTKNEALAWFGR